MMRNIDEELRKLNSIDIKKQNPILDAIEQQEKAWIDDFNNNIEVIFANNLLPIVLELSKTPNIENIKTRTITINGQQYTIPENILQDFHKSYINDKNLKKYYEERLKLWFIDKKERIKSTIKYSKSYQDILSKRVEFFALASLAITAFHKKDHMVLRKAQKRTAIAMSDGDVAELSSGEGKTLSGVLTAFLQSLTGDGVHVMTSNNYLSRRDYEELLPIYSGLGVSVGYLPESVNEYASLIGEDYDSLDSDEKKLLNGEFLKCKQLSYRADITFGALHTFVFDYLSDNLIRNPAAMIQRVNNPGFAIIDEIDYALVDNAEVPYVIADLVPTYVENMSLKDLCDMLGIDYEKTLSSVHNEISDVEHLSYEEARYVAVTYSDDDLLENPVKYLELANEFYKSIRVYTTEDNVDNGKTAVESFQALIDESKFTQKNPEFRERYGIVYSKELNQYKIYDEVYDKYLEECYYKIHISGKIAEYKEDIIKDPNYVKNKDYYFENDGVLKLTRKAAERIVKDPNYSKLIEDYENFMTRTSSFPATLIHYLNKAIIANLLLKENVDYIVDNNKVYTLKNGRVQVGSKYSDGLQQAIEIKEGIPPTELSKITMSSSSVSHLNYFLRYGMFSGMTGTAPELTLGNVYRKRTIKIPKAVVEEKNVKDLLGVDIQNTKFTRTLDEKINLIVKSVEDSQTLIGKTRKQPVLIVVSDPNEIKVLYEALIARGWQVNVLTAETPKEDEALIIANAGYPGVVTLSTEMTGRGTDIILGGNRDLILDIETDIYIRELEKQYGPQNFDSEKKEMIRKYVEQESQKIEKKELNGTTTSLKIRSKEEEEAYRKDLERTGLKVIISGIFTSKRSKDQVIGRTGRNGVSGVCQEIVCLDDLRKVGKSHLKENTTLEESFKDCPQKPTGELDVNSELYSQVSNEIDKIRKQNELRIQNIIKQTQQLNSYSAKLNEEYRDQRRRLLVDQIDTEQTIFQMISSATDAIISSYIADNEIDAIALTKPLSESGLNIDIEAISLEVKQTLGVTFDPNIVSKSKISLLEFRDAIIRTAKLRNAESNKDKEKEMLLKQNEFMIAGTYEILENSITTSKILSISGLGSQKEALVNIEFGNIRKKLLYESYKRTLKSYIGIPLTFEEYKTHIEKKEKASSLIISPNPIGDDYDAKEPIYEENNLDIIGKLKSIKDKLDKEDLRELQKVDYEIRKNQAKSKNKDLETYYKNLNVKPWIFIDKMVDGNKVTELVLVRLDLTKSDDVLKEKQTNKVLKFPLYMSNEEKDIA